MKANENTVSFLHQEIGDVRKEFKRVDGLEKKVESKVSYSMSSRMEKKIQSPLVISKSKGIYEILRDILTSTYQVCRIEEKTIRTTTFNKKYM